MSPTRKNTSKVKSLPKKAVSTRKAGEVKGGLKQPPYPKSGTPGA